MINKIKPNDISNHYRNIKHKPCKAAGYDMAWDITENKKFIGELFFSKEYKEWCFILDNFPMPRRVFRTTFPQTKQSFEDSFKRINILLKQ